jgi:PIN domain nuclease of toxin-antitoxin system
LKTWLIDTALFATLGPASSQKSGLRHWLDTHREPVFLSTVSLVEIEVAIGRVPASQQARIRTLQDWLDGLISNFSDRIHPVDAAVAVRAGRLLPLCHTGLAAIAFMTQCSWRPLRRTAMACSRNGMGCLAHGLR